MKHLAILAAATVLPLMAFSQDIRHERIEWSDIWVTNADTDTNTKVLLVGDSIVRGYFSEAEKALGKDISCARYTTSKFLSHPDYLGELGLLIKRFDFDVIHFNNGLHGWGYTEEEYRAGLAALVAFLKETAPNARLVWAMSTPVRVGKDIEKVNEERTNRVKARNAIAREVMAANGIPVNDLFALVEDHTEYYSQDGTHFNGAGKKAQGRRRASSETSAWAPTGSSIALS